MVLGQALAYAVMVPIAEVGVDYGLTGQVAVRATLGFWGARLLSSPVPRDRRDVLVRGAGARRRARDPGDRGRDGRGKPPLVPIALGARALPRNARGARLRRDALAAADRAAALARVHGRVVALYPSTDDPRFDAGRVFDSPDQHLTWVGFAASSP